VQEPLTKKRVHTVFQVIEFTNADDFIEVILWIEYVVIKDKLNVINYTVIQVFPVAAVIDAIKPCSCKAPFANVAICVDHDISWTEQAVIVQSNHYRNFSFAKHWQYRCGQTSFI